MRVKAFRWFYLFALAGILSIGAGHANAAPASAQQPTSTGPSLRGTSTGVLGPVSLHAGLVIVHGRSNGAGNFAADLINQDPSNPTPVTQEPSAASKDFYELFDAIGRYDGAAAALLKSDDDYYLHVSLASGPFEVTFEQPTPATVTPVAQTDFKGKGQQVTPYFSLSAGTYTAAFTNDSSALRVKLYLVDDLGGGAIVSDETGYYGDELIDTTFDPNQTSVGVQIPVDGVYVLYVNPSGSGAGNWTASIK